jgi:murein DD-endopeptidase MepM/ murein hydrolase activator NlpD
MKDIRFEDKTLPILFKKTGETFSMLGVSLDSRPGDYKIIVEYRRNKRPYIAQLPFKIIEKTFPEEHITVKKEMVHLSSKDLERVRSDQLAMAEAIKGVSSDIRWSSPFVWPVKSEITSPFGLRRFFNGEQRSPHSGVDIRAGEGDVIKAANSGVVALARDCFFSGKTLVLDHGGGLFTMYAHLSSFHARVGDIVHKGDIIGFAGSSGRATGPHLHWGVSLLGTRVDPVSLMELLGEVSQGE